MDAYENELKSFIGEDGNRKLTCISWLPVPEKVHSDARQAEYNGVHPVQPCCALAPKSGSCIPEN